MAITDSPQQIARAFAYSGSSLLLGVLVYFLTQGLIPLVELPEIAGVVFISGFVLIFLNLSFAMGRRFCSRSFEMERFPYVLAIVLVLPTLVLSMLTERLNSNQGYLTFYVIIFFSGILGAFLGIKSGSRKREKLIREVLESGSIKTQDDKTDPES